LSLRSARCAERDGQCLSPRPAHSPDSPRRRLNAQRARWRSKGKSEASGVKCGAAPAARNLVRHKKAPAMMVITGPSARATKLSPEYGGAKDRLRRKHITIRVSSLDVTTQRVAARSWLAAKMSPKEDLRAWGFRVTLPQLGLLWPGGGTDEVPPSGRAYFSLNSQTAHKVRPLARGAATAAPRWLRTLDDVRELMRHFPAEHRARPTWCQRRRPARGSLAPRLPIGTGTTRSRFPSWVKSSNPHYRITRCHNEKEVTT